MYRVYRSTTPDVAPIAGNRVVNYIPAAPPIRWTDGWLTNETPYYYVVTAVSSDGTESAPSSAASVTPSSALPRPATPNILSVTPGSRMVTVTHDLVADAATYQVYYSTTNDLTSYASLQGHPRVSTTGTGPIGIGNLTAGTPYWFAVTARNLDGESDPTPMVSATPTP